MAQRVIDADGHCVEKDVDLAEYAHYLGRPLKGAYGLGSMPLFPSLDGWFRVAGDKLAGGDLTHWQSFLDETGIDRTFLYPTAGLAYGLIQDTEWAVSVAQAYNDWLADRYLRQDARIHGMALIPIHDPERAAGELRRAVQQLGLSGAVLPSAQRLHRGYGDPWFDPIYAEAQALNVPLAVHGAPSCGFGFDYIDSFIETHTLEHPIPLLIHFTSMIFRGVFDRFPTLRVAYLESGAGWVPFMLDRLEEEFERRGARWCPELQRTPREYIRGGNIYVSCEVEEQTLPFVLQAIGEDHILFASDYPHERDREAFLGDIPEFLARTDLSVAVKDKILYQNALRFYGLSA